MARTVVGVVGFRELDRALSEDLPKNVGKAVARRAVKRAGDEMAEAQRRRAHPTVAATVTVKVSSKNLTGLADYGDVLRGGGSVRDASAALRSARREAKASGGGEGNRFSAKVGPTDKRAHWFEFSTGPRHKKTTGAYTGVMPATPFIRPAFDETKGQSVATMRAGLADEVEKARARIARKLARGK